MKLSRQNQWLDISMTQHSLTHLKSSKTGMPLAIVQNTTRVVDPPIDQHEFLRQPMTRGEKLVFQLFDRLLSPEWEIYVQPHLNGLRPDFVILNPNVGIGVYEVKDWNLDAMKYHVEGYPSGYQELRATHRGETFTVENPFEKIRRYKDEIYNIYCPRLRQKAGYGAITAGVIFPFADAARIMELQRPFLNEKEQKKAKTYWPVAGESEIKTDDINAILPLLNREANAPQLMFPALAADLRSWLVEPDFAREQRRPLELDRNQRNLAETRTKSGLRRIKGPAGSGKSLVLAARAASLINEGKEVLIVTFNMTLWHYLRDLVVRDVKSAGNSSQLTFRHFHKWCGEVCCDEEYNTGYADDYAEIMKPIAKIKAMELGALEEARMLRPILPAILNDKVPALATLAAKHPNAKRYDAILVDEGQDYLPHWWNALRNALRDNGEMLLVADATQDVYGTAKSWTDLSMKGAGFEGGSWATLDVSYRLPPDAHPVVRDFADRFLPIETCDIPDPDQQDMDFFPCDLRWIQCDEQDAMRQCVNAILAMMRQTGKAGLANADITFLTDNIDFGKEVVDELETYRVRSAHTFAREKAEQNRRKMAFFMGDARVKATTLHSFKGWEARLLVIHIGHATGQTDLASIYAALTRLRRSQEGSHLTVVCTAPKLADFGAGWPVHEDASTGFTGS
ncbi:UvrD-helicase domain-containing protein [Sulfitobacter sp. SK012]|uniref:UvrD-helicase domain-containing protein n=1 Tax=Sulfitobacter sp. SK012 TaxID=1389005 RepID=UPI0020C76FBE|nr:UvrD-helicase domain-containing protein [Sulfitobacter sp. SK012]